MKNNLNKYSNAMLSATLLLIFSTEMHAQIIASWDFTPPTVTQGTPSFTSAQTASYSDPGLTVSTLSFGTGYAGYDNNANYQHNSLSAYYTRGDASSLSDAITKGYYWTFTVTVNPGYTANLSSFSAAAFAVSADSTSTEYLLSSQTGFSGGDSLGSGSIRTGYQYSNGGTPPSFPTITPGSANLSTDPTDFSDLTNADGPIEFRVYLVNAQSSYGNTGIFLENLQGTVINNTPEPSTCGLMAAGLLTLVFVYRRRMFVR